MNKDKLENIDKSNPKPNKITSPDTRDSIGQSGRVKIKKYFSNKQIDRLARNKIILEESEIQQLDIALSIYEHNLSTPKQTREDVYKVLKKMEEFCNLGIEVCQIANQSVGRGALQLVFIEFFKVINDSNHLNEVDEFLTQNSAVSSPLDDIKYFSLDIEERNSNLLAHFEMYRRSILNAISKYNEDDTLKLGGRPIDQSRFVVEDALIHIFKRIYPVLAERGESKRWTSFTDCVLEVMPHDIRPKVSTYNIVKERFFQTRKSNTVRKK